VTKKLLIALSTLALAAFALAACGGDDEESASTEAEATSTEGSGGGETVTFEADPGGDLAWTETEASAAAGDLTIELVNEATTPHNVYIEDEGGEILAESETITESTTTTTASLEAGTFTFFCDIPAHREAGMEGTLTVE